MNNKETVKNLSVKEIIENVQAELTQAIETIKNLHELINEPIGTAEYVTETDMLIYDMEQSIERLSSIEYTIITAIMAGVYAGNIESMGKGFIDDFGADSITHCYEYLELAEQYDSPWNNNNKIAADCVHNDISDLMWSKYAENMELKEIKTKFGSIYIEELFSKRKEEDRIKIFDSNKNYMDYFDVEHLQNCANEMGHSLRWEYCTRINNFKETNYIADLADLIYTDLHASYITKNWLEGVEYLKINNIFICNLTEFEENEYVNKIGDYYVILSD